MGTAEKMEQVQVRLTDVEPSVGRAEELPPAAKARLNIAVGVLAALGMLMTLSGAALIYGPENRLEQTRLVFDFMKTMVPPIVTLVIGFYFRGETQ